MFQSEFTAKIDSVSVRTKQLDALVIRTCKIKLTREFDALVAAGIGGDAHNIRDSLMAGGISKAEIPIDAMKMDGRLVFGSEICKVRGLKGIKAICTANADQDADPDEAPPSVTLELECLFDLDAWGFLGKHAAAWIGVTLTAQQRELPFSLPVDAETQMAIDLGKAMSDAMKRRAVDVPAPRNVTEEQDAESPEEAEALREKRLAEEAADRAATEPPKTLLKPPRGHVSRRRLDVQVQTPAGDVPLGRSGGGRRTRRSS